MNPPNPKPEIIHPDTTPFLPGRCEIPQYSDDEYIKPFPMPNPTEYKYLNTIGSLIYEQINTADRVKHPPIRSTIFGLILSQRYMPKGKKGVATATMIG